MKSGACRRNLTRLSALIDNELSPAERRNLEAHLSVCQSCSRYLEELRANSALLKSLPALEPREEAILELKARLRLAAPIGEDNVCETVRVRLSAYIDNELAEPERQHVEQHLALCPDCSRYLEELRTISTRFNLLPHIEPSPATVRSLKTKVRAAQRPARRGLAPVFALPRFAHTRMGLAAAAAVVVLAVGLVVLLQVGHRDNVAGNLLKPTLSGQAREMRLMLDDFNAAKRRLLDELKLNEAANMRNAEKVNGIYEVFDPTQSRTHGRIMHSIIFGEQRAARAPVESHVLFASYGD